MFDPNLQLLSASGLGSTCQSKKLLALGFQGDSSWSRMWELNDFFVFFFGILSRSPFLVSIHRDA